MSRVFVTGDTHRLMDIVKIDQFDRKVGNELTRDDYLIILGDFGGIWTGRDIWGRHFPKDVYQAAGMQNYDKYPRKYWEKKPYTVLFLDGNHENHSALDMYPVESWHGGKVHKIYENTYHLMRGQVFELCGKKLFVMGGAESSDKAWRQEGFSWWPREMPSYEEYEEAVTNLERRGGKVDCILTHCAPETTVCSLNMPHMYYRSKNELTTFFDTLAQTIEFKAWYFGHYHNDSDIGKFHMRYNKVDELEVD